MTPSRQKIDIKISGRMCDLPDDYIKRMAEICTCYFPDQSLMEEVVRHHLEDADTTRLAWHGQKIVGFSIASKYRMQTPFYHKPTNVLFQRMLYLDPDILYRRVGLRLLSVTLIDLLGWLWPLRRLVTICRTQNPVVARLMNMYEVAYPQAGQPLPADIRQFAESLLPMLGAEVLDEKCRLVGTLDSFRGKDYTDIWNRYLHRRNNQYEALMLDSAFTEEKGRIMNNGAFIFMVAYARPMHFIRYLSY